MSRGHREAELRVRGLGLGARFVVTMTAALTLVMALAGLVLYGAATRIAEGERDGAISRAVRSTRSYVV